MGKDIHKWEFNSIGKAPFQFVGAYEIPSSSLAEHNPDAYNNRLREMPPCSCGICTVCGQAIVINCIVRDGTGKIFPVGSDCIKKAGDAGMTSSVKEWQNARVREKRRKKAEEEREARLQAQREKNGGLTDWEIRQKRAEEERVAREIALEPVKKLLAPLAERLEDGKGGFRDSVAEYLKSGSLPDGRGFDIMVEILAKQAGRKGSSRKFKAEEILVLNTISDAEELLERI